MEPPRLRRILRGVFGDIPLCLIAAATLNGAAVEHSSGAAFRSAAILSFATGAAVTSAANLSFAAITWMLHGP